MEFLSKSIRSLLFSLNCHLFSTVDLLLKSFSDIENLQNDVVNNM